MNKYILIAICLTGHVVTDAYAGDNDVVAPPTYERYKAPQEDNSYSGGWTTYYSSGQSYSSGPNGHHCSTSYGTAMSYTSCR